LQNSDFLAGLTTKTLMMTPAELFGHHTFLPCALSKSSQIPTGDDIPLSNNGRRFICLLSANVDLSGENDKSFSLPFQIDLVHRRNITFLSLIIHGFQKVPFHFPCCSDSFRY